MITIYKANGYTFNSLEDVEKYANENGYLITDQSEFEYKGRTIICVNLKSK